MDIEKYPEIILFLENHSIIGIKKHSSTKFPYSMPCIYCDDATRKSNINHGHLYISKSIPFFKCFRCDTSGHLKKLLLDLEFNNSNILKEISTSHNFNILPTYIKTHVKNNIYSLHESFKKSYPNEYSFFIDYIVYRIGDINYLDFKLYPSYSTKFNNTLLLNFNNNNNELCNSRIIYPQNSKIRYIKPNTLSTDLYYHFQNINNIYNYENIVICEGEIDLINLYLYGTFNNAFYISSTGKSGYIGLLTYLISNYIIIGSFKIHIIFDKDCDNKYISSLKYKINNLKRKLNVFYYKSNKKDVSIEMSYYEI